MAIVDSALYLAEKGFYVFPCEPNGKLPIIKDFANTATRDPEKIAAWFAGTNRNVGIITDKFKDDKALVVIDIDVKGTKRGDETILALELDDYVLPKSLEQITPSGGRHIIYTTGKPLRQGVNVFGDGVDVRSKGGYIVGPGSSIDGKLYTPCGGISTPVDAPSWVVSKLETRESQVLKSDTPITSVNTAMAYARGKKFIGTVWPTGEGGRNHQLFKVAAELKDYGCTPEQVLELSCMWNDRCAPPLDLEEVKHCVQSVYKYSGNAPGVKSFEHIFGSVADDVDGNGVHPADRLNDNYAFVKSGAFVIQETTDHKARFCTIRLSPNDMHAWFANKTMMLNDKMVPLSKVWMGRESRREYDAVVFSPKPNVDKRFYNLWRGFSVTPAKTGDHPSVEQFKEHALENVCGGDKILYQWLIGYFAHLVQKPWEKPLVALVFRGDKGTGKNALVERVGHLFRSHFLVADDDRYLLSNFNSHLESALFLVLDEASWAGDKKAEGRLKGLITGAEHLIERKGLEPYRVDNLTRVAILGNEKWLVPATQDERRFAVFTVGNGRRRDNQFFESMRVGMENGGYAHLLKFLLDFDISDFKVNTAPSTQGLLDQKHASVPLVAEWWLDCLSTNCLVGAVEDVFPEILPTSRMRNAFETWARQRNVRSRLPGPREFAKDIKEVAPSLVVRKRWRTGDDTESTYAYANPGLAVLRKDWEAYIGGAHDWWDAQDEEGGLDD